MNPRISIITTAYNAEAYVSQAIQSIFDQTFTNWELLIADDASSDDTRRIIDGYAERDPRIRCFHNDVNLHYLRTRNGLFHQVLGEYVTFLDADDWMLPHRLQVQLDWLDSHADHAMCGCFVEYADEVGEPLKMFRPDPPIHDDGIKDALDTYSPFTGSTLMIRTEVLKAIGGYRMFFNGLGFEDYDLAARISEKFPTANVPERLYVYRQMLQSTSRMNSLSNPKKYFSKDIVKFLRKQRIDGGLDAIERNAFSEIDALVNSKLQVYLNNPSLFYLDTIASHVYSGFFIQALKVTLTSIREYPRSVYLYRTFFYIIRKMLISKLLKN